MTCLTRRYAILIGAVTLALSTGSASYADTREDNIELMRKMYAHLSAILAVKDNALAPNENLLILAAPGILIDPKLDMNRPQDAATIVNALVDKVMEPSWYLSQRSSRMSDIYREILRSHVVPLTDLSRAEKDELETARRQLYRSDGSDTQLMSDYRKVKQALESSLIAISKWQEANVGKPVPAELRVALQTARDDYVRFRGDLAKGYLLTVSKYDRRNGEFWFDELQKRFSANFVDNYYYGLVNFYPSYATWLDKELEWQRIQFSSSDLERRTHNESSSTTAGLGVSWGLWSIGGDYGGDEQSTHLQAETKNLNIAFDVLRVELDIAWMDSTLFESRAWEWSRNSGYAGQVVSSGADYAKGSMPTGLMPFIPTSILIARNVEMTADWGLDIQDTFSKRSGGGGSIGFGPFRLGGRTSKSESSTYTLAQANGNNVTFPNPQVIGYFVQVLPKSP
ncbi:hypothetical protein GHK71_00400, partial [Sinorhizobium meliloti]